MPALVFVISSELLTRGDARQQRVRLSDLTMSAQDDTRYGALQPNYLAVSPMSPLQIHCLPQEMVCPPHRGSPKLIHKCPVDELPGRGHRVS